MAGIPSLNGGVGFLSAQIIPPRGDAPQGVESAIAQPLHKLLELRIDDRWLSEHENLRSNFGVYGSENTPLVFTFFDTESGFSEQSAVNYNDTEIVGRPEAYKTFANTGNKQVSFVFKFHVQGLDRTQLNAPDQDARMEQAIQNEVIRPARFLDSLKYPVEDELTQLSYAPPPVYMQFGRLMTLRAVVTEVSIQWQPPYMPSTLLPMAADVNVTFDVVRQRPINYLKQGGPIDGRWS